MGKQQFFDNILENYFVERKVSVEGIGEILSSIKPVFGKVIHSVEEMEDGTQKITYIDEHIVSGFIDMKTGKEVEVENEDELNMSTTISTIYVDKDNTISVIEHGFGIFTKVNKEQVLVVTSLIGKKVEF